MTPLVLLPCAEVFNLRPSDRVTRAATISSGESAPPPTLAQLGTITMSSGCRETPMKTPSCVLIKGSMPIFTPEETMTLERRLSCKRSLRLATCL